ncbi:MAG: DUF3494 domain-containing protein [Thermoleophilia bacterium]|nr:DUF3494 domain-containing protein [Thermoleophilia bacterium]
MAWLAIGSSLVLAGFGAASASAAPTPMVDLGQASPYAVLSGASVGNTVSAPGAPHTTIRGDLGIKADTAPTGFPPGVVTGTIRQGSAVGPAHADLAAAYAEVATRPGGAPLAGTLVGTTILPGLHTISGAASNTGTVTLNGGGDPNAVFVIQVNGALSFAAGSQVVLANGARASRVFWQVNGAGTVGALSTFTGTLMASAAIGMGNGTLVNGRAFARDGALTLDNNQFYGGPPVVTVNGGGSAQTTDTTPTISGTTDLEAPATVSVTIAGQILTATPVDGAWSVNSGILPNGTYPVVASVLDGAGNPGNATQQLTVDTVLPEVTLDGGATVTTNDATSTISGTSDVLVDTVVRVTVGSQTLRALVHADGSWNIRPVTLTDGPHAVSASVSDLAGNESTDTQTLTVDTTAPAVTISGGASALTNDATPEISGTAGGAAGSTISVDVNNETLTGLVDGGGSWSVVAASLSDGPHRIVMSVSDGAGNAASVTQMLTVDTVAPLVTINGGPSATTGDSDPTIAGTSDAAPGTTITVSIAGNSMTTLVQANHSWNTNPGFVGKGKWKVQASAEDPAGNLGTASQTLSIAPGLALPPPGSPPEITGLRVAPRKVHVKGKRKNAMRRRGPAIKLNLTEEAKVRFSITRNSAKARVFRAQLKSGSSSVRIPVKIRKKLRRGSYKLIVVATDSAGQSSNGKQAGFKVVR